MSDIRVADNPDQHRFEAHVDGTLAGFADYRFRGEDIIVFTHTEVDPDFERQGIGSALARGALDQVRAVGKRRVVALCPFIGAWIQSHPSYQDLVAP